jgi:hypothetical protein
MHKSSSPLSSALRLAPVRPLRPAELVSASFATGKILKQVQDDDCVYNFRVPILTFPKITRGTLIPIAKAFGEIGQIIIATIKSNVFNPFV